MAFLGQLKMQKEEMLMCNSIISIDPRPNDSETADSQKDTMQSSTPTLKRQKKNSQSAIAYDGSVSNDINQPFYLSAIYSLPWGCVLL